MFKDIGVERLFLTGSCPSFGYEVTRTDHSGVLQLCHAGAP
jgi:hypothetical protein